jgi:hypothetical protein
VTPRPHRQRVRERILLGFFLVWSLGSPTACSTTRAAVSMKLDMSDSTPPDASVIIDEQFVGLLGYVAAHGVRLPEGEHRITVEREGYFPWDRIVVSDREPIRLQVTLWPIPD